MKSRTYGISDCRSLENCFELSSSSEFENMRTMERSEDKEEKESMMILKLVRDVDIYTD